MFTLYSLKLTKELLLAGCANVGIVKVADKVVVKLNDPHVRLHADVLINRVDATAVALAHGSEAVNVARQVCDAVLVICYVKQGIVVKDLLR